MSSKVVIADAVVEITVPTPLDVYGTEMDMVGMKMRTVKLHLVLRFKDFKIRLPARTPPGELGSMQMLTHEGGEVITIKDLVISDIKGDMLPVFDSDKGEMVFFTMEKVDEPIIVK